MSKEYVGAGYWNPGYTEGDFVSIVPDAPDTKIVVFVSRGSNDFAHAANSASNQIRENEVAVLLMPDTGQIGFVSKLGSALLGGDPAKIAERISVELSAKFVAQDGTIFATPNVKKNGSEFLISVPENLSGGEYNIVLDVDVNAPCEVK